MADRVQLKAEKREILGKKVRQLRRAGKLPATVYGHRVEPQSIQVDTMDMRDAMRKAGTTQLIDLHIDTQPARPVLVRKAAIDPKRNTVIHVEFFQANLREKLTTHLPLHFVGESPAVKEGGIFLHILDYVDIESLPQDVLADAPVVIATTGGQPDPIYGLLLLVGYAEWRRRSVSPVFMGLAVGTKQLAWFFVPFYLVVVLRQFGWRETLRRSGIVTLIFLLMNAPFIVQGPQAYLASVGAPVRDPMFPLGIGSIALFVSNVLPMLPKLAFTAAELMAWACGTGAMALLRSLPPAAGIVLAGLPLFFAWRSLTSYFYLLPLITLAVVLADSRQRTSEPAQA